MTAPHSHQHSLPDVAPVTPPGVRGLLWVIFRAPLLVVIRVYKRFLSPLLPPSCRFYPSCSAYGYEAISIHGPFKGGLLTTLRILKCQPFHPGGFDPVPGSVLEQRLKNGSLKIDDDDADGRHEHKAVPPSAHT